MVLTLSFNPEKTTNSLYACLFNASCAACGRGRSPWRGVEEAFTTDRVMTISFHKYVVGFFPQIGHFEDIGHGDGTDYSLNVPLVDGLDDDSFVALFKLVIQKVMDVYQPNVVILQYGTDSLFGDLLGTFNLSIKGVEEAFFTTDKVMTVSFHKNAVGFFPQIGHFEDIGHADGTGYSLNVPLVDGLDEDSFVALFKLVIQKVMDVYQPNAVVLQCGADSLFGDLLGTFNLSIKGHAFCLHFLRKFILPMMVLGGDGYSVENVSKCGLMRCLSLLNNDLEERDTS
nr:histone deacetylase 6-like [Tanacetum cinerariifolium]